MPDQIDPIRQILPNSFQRVQLLSHRRWRIAESFDESVAW